MKYDLTAEEAQHIEAYRNLLDEFKKAADANLEELFTLQTEVMRNILQK